MIDLCRRIATRRTQHVETKLHKLSRSREQKQPQRASIPALERFAYAAKSQAIDIQIVGAQKMCDQTVDLALFFRRKLRFGLLLRLPKRFDGKLRRTKLRRLAAWNSVVDPQDRPTQVPQRRLRIQLYQPAKLHKPRLDLHFNEELRALHARRKRKSRRQAGQNPDAAPVLSPAATDDSTAVGFR